MIKDDVRENMDNMAIFHKQKTFSMVENEKTYKNEDQGFLDLRETMMEESRKLKPATIYKASKKLFEEDKKAEDTL